MRKTRAKSSWLAALAICALVAGCQGGTIHKKSVLGPFKYLSIDARQRLVLQKAIPSSDPIDYGAPREIVCAEPSPNALVARAAVLSASGGQVSPSGRDTSAAIAAGQSEAVTAAGARSQTIELLRDAYYRACEGLINGVIGKEEYSAILANIDTSMIALAAVDALGGATLAGNNAIGANATVTPGDDGASTITLETDSSPGTGAQGGANQHAAQALKEIALTALRIGAARTDKVRNPSGASTLQAARQ
ncbi:MAG: hypothetical protein OXR62_08380 [Ahrensia sp.]|nr:hypothetical protein [Ahrensia sp.]